MKVTPILLAAGQGTRMKSDLPKILHPIAGKPMIWHPLEAIKGVTTEKPVVIIGHGAEAVIRFLGEAAHCILQEPQLGTAHAVLQAEALLKDRTELVLVSYADMPLLLSETYQMLIEAQQHNTGPMSMLTVIANDPRGFGRILRKPDGSVEGIVEELVASPEQMKIKELNVGGYCFNAAWLWEALHHIQKNPRRGEYYLTDTVELAVREDLNVQAVIMDDAEEAIGINTRLHLAEAEAVVRTRINRQHMLNGVTMIDPASTFIESGVQIGEDTTILPNTHLQGEVRIGEDCILGPNTLIRDSRIESRCKVVASVLEGAWLEEDVNIGPFARLRRGAHLMRGVHIGNFGEVKDSTLGPGVKMGHFSYIGDTIIGADTNIGAGTITCNYDGERKNSTEIGEDVFIGSDTMLVAPLKVGDGARTGAGAVVTKNVPPDTLVVGMPARAIRKLERKSKKRTTETRSRGEK
jgi:bifunctional UDP-N-acetylglucosamine pyrophosphorylase/glucosamine-1-phosphate N-acetyltransferase